MLKHSLISTQKGQLSLRGVVFENIAMEDAPLIALGRGSDALVMESVTDMVNERMMEVQCSFDGITRNKGRGSVFEESSSAEDEELALSNAHFDLSSSGSVITEEE